MNFIKRIANKISDNYLNEWSEYNLIRNKYKNKENYLKAPNGNISKLTEYQWILVRTPSFKNWFGDWENDLENSSKVLDSNNEPLVVFHGTQQAGFSCFDNSKRTFYDEDLPPIGCSFFTDKYDVAKSYSGTLEVAEIGKNFHCGNYPVFLNLKNVEKYDFNGCDWEGKKGNLKCVRFSTNDLSERAIKNKLDGIIIYNVVDMGYQSIEKEKSNVYIVANPTLIKSATDNIGSFKKESKNIIR